jgi:hypothetical protein
MLKKYGARHKISCPPLFAVAGMAFRTPLANHGEARFVRKIGYRREIFFMRLPRVFLV